MDPRSPQRFRPRVRTPFTLAIILGVSACGDSCDRENATVTASETVVDVPQAPAIAGISISPAEAVIDLDVPLDLRVDARDGDNNYIWLEDHPSVSVAWSGTPERPPGVQAPLAGPGFSFSVTTGSSTTLLVTDSSILRLTIEGRVSWTTSEVLATAIVGIVGVGITPSKDAVRAIPTSSPLVAMLDGCELDGAGPVPVHALTPTFTTTKLLDENLTEVNCTRPTEFALFSVFHRMAFRDAATLQEPPAQRIWTNGVGDELRADTLPWSAPDQVDLHVYYFVPAAAGTPDIHKAGESRVTEANQILQNSRLGMRFLAIHAPPSNTPRDGDCAPAYVQNVLGIDLTTARLNLAFVRDFAAVVGKSCPPSTTGGGRIIIIDMDLASHETLAHEIGHALGHERKNLGFDHVRVNSTPGFAATNLMHEKVAALSREWLTIGQVFRMNVDTGSWYQHAQGILNRQPSRRCGCEPYVDDVCPRLDAHPGVVPIPAPTNYCGSSP